MSALTVMFCEVVMLSGRSFLMKKPVRFKSAGFPFRAQEHPGEVFT